MRKLILIITFLVGLSFTNMEPARTANDNERYVFQVISFTLPGDALSGQSELNSQVQQELMERFQSYGPPGVVESSAGFSERLHSAGGRFISYPTITTRPGDLTGAELVMDPQYFEKGDDGRFELKYMDPREAPGMSLKFVYSEMDDSRYIEFDYSLEIRVIESREQLPGVMFDVGKPIVQKFSSDEVRNLEQGKWLLLEAYELSEKSTGKSDILMIVLKVRSEAEVRRIVAERGRR